MRCISCGSMQRRRDGHTRLGGQRWRCTACHRRFTARSSSAFSGHGFADEIVTLAIRWYVRYRLSYADVAELLAERGVMVSRSTIYRWVQRFLPLFAEAARTYCQPVGGKWRVDETYCRLDGRWAYCYRAIDEDGQVVEAYCIAIGTTPRRHRPSLSELYCEGSSHAQACRHRPGAVLPAR